jgi:predicted metal-dependent hydrolase
MFEFGGGYELLVQDEWLWNYRWRRKLFVGEDGFFEDLLQAATQYLRERMSLETQL